MSKLAKHKSEAPENGIRFEGLVPDERLRSRMMTHLINEGDLLGADSPFTEILQQAVNDVLEAEMDVFQGE